MASRGGGAIFQPPRGRPTKVTKPSATPRRRRPDAVPNQDPNLDHVLVAGSAADTSPDGDGQPDLEPSQPQPPHEHDPSQHHHDPHQQHHPHHDDGPKYHDPSQLDHHAAFDPEGAAAAAAAAAQAQQHQQQHQQPDSQMDLSAAASILTGGPGAMGLNPHEHSDLAQHLGEGSDALAAAGGAGMGQATEDVARQSGYDSVMIESALAKRLAREPGMRLASQRRPEQTLNLQRRSNVEALFAHIAGEVAVVPCKNCHKGHGPWTSCVIVDGQMCGSCANCWFNASGARCSFHETRNPPTHAPVLGAPEAGFQLHSVPPIAANSFNYASAVSSAVDPVVKGTVDRAMHDMRTADKRTRHLLMIEVAARSLAYNIMQYEEQQAQEDHQQNAQHAQAQQYAHNQQQQQQPQQQSQGVPEGSLMDDDPDAP